MASPVLSTCAAAGLLAASACAADSASTPAIAWTTLPPLPDPEGFAGAFCGVSNGALVFAGGANLLEPRWENPMRKQWVAHTFVLEKPGGPWIPSQPLPHPLGYGVSATTDTGVICVGGGDSRSHSAEVFELRWTDGALRRIPLPPLPSPCANACGAVVGRTLYVAGGIEAPDSPAALRQFLALNLDAPERGWSPLEPWPGPGRMLAVAGSLGEHFYLFSGASLHPTPDGPPARIPLRDAYAFSPQSGWKRLADLPRAAIAAPSPATPLAASRLLILGGDDGTLAGFAPLHAHPGFSTEILSYDPTLDRWSNAGRLPFSKVTTPAVSWGPLTIIPSGEVRPRRRSPEVWGFSANPKP
ncbi:MAG: hypothetical protein RLZZ244_2648 [Verrucomicrobiota bacterium]